MAHHVNDAARRTRDSHHPTGRGLPLEHRYVAAAGAYRFFQPVRGGASMIVARDGTFLFANSAVPPSRHEQAFIDGRRTDPEVFRIDPRRAR